MRHLVFLVEEPSMEAFLRGLLPRIIPEACGFEYIEPSHNRSGSFKTFQAAVAEVVA